jgi:hypothetical protein
MSSKLIPLKVNPKKNEQIFQIIKIVSDEIEKKIQ